MILSRLLSRYLTVPSVRAIRGAISVESDCSTAISSATTELLDQIRNANSLQDDEIISAIFTVTPDLVAAFPAGAARQAGWHHVPLLCTTEIPVPGGLPRCLRLMIHVERIWTAPPEHVYLGEASSLRPDLIGKTMVAD